MLFMLALFIVNIFIAIIIHIYGKLTTGICKCSRHLVGKVVLITGGNSGIGYETAKDLACRGARIILADKSKTEGTAACNSIKEETGSCDVIYHHLDLASLASVRTFADDIIKTEKRIDILINNADSYEVENIKTENGLSLQMQTNYFGHFLLTSLLLPLLKSSTPSRIINLTSMSHRRGKIDFEDLSHVKETEAYNPEQAYQTSKLCNILMTIELARRLEGTGVTSNCTNPGLVSTDLVRKLKNSPLQYLMPILERFCKTPWEGAQTTIFLAVSPEVDGVSGKYYSDCLEREPAVLASDKELASKLWNVTENLVALKN